MSNKVTASKPKIGGALYKGTKGIALPTSAVAELNEGFKSLGYISEEGLTNSNSPKAEETKAWGGDVVFVSNTERPDTFKFQLIETIDTEVLKTVYGEESVTGDLQSGIAIHVNTKDLPEIPYVVDMILKDNILKRIVIPNGKVTEVGEIKYDGKVIGFDLTISAIPDTEGNSHYEYIKEQAQNG